MSLRHLTLILAALTLALPSHAQHTDGTGAIPPARPDSLPPLSAGAEPPLVAPWSPADTAAAGDSLAGRLDHILSDPYFERTQVGIYVYDLTADRPLYARGQLQTLRPASCQKLLTAITALDLLGTTYRYTTLVATSGEQADSVLRGNVVLRGGFDPLLSAADLRALADSLRVRGIRRIEGDLVLDRSFKDTLAYGWGWCWDDEEVPLSPLLCDGRATLPASWPAALAQAGIAWSGSIRYGALPPDARAAGRATHTLDQVLLPMLKESDNLCAESLFYQIAAHGGKAHAGRDEAAAAVSGLAARLGFRPSDFLVADGSGLSLYNYASPQLLVAFLRHAYRNAPILRHLLPALPVAGEDGTLRRRMKYGPARSNVRAKTGPLEGVATLAGYCTAPDGHTLCFAIMNQGVRRGADARRFQDRICQALAGATH